MSDQSQTSEPTRVCRQATDDDAPAIGRVIVAAWQAAYAGLMPTDFLEGLDPAKVQAGWAKPPSSLRDFRRVATLDGRVVGACGGGRPRDREPTKATAELYSINVSPSCWGNGVGAALLEDAKEAMIAQGYSDAILWVVAENMRARRFYDRAGWEPTGEERTTSELIGAPIHELCLAYTLV